jgi:sulfur-carrier protein
MTITVRVRYFASIREALGTEELIVTAAHATVAEVRDQLIATSSAHAAVLARSRVVRSALNQVLCAEHTVVSDHAELAFFPPVTGG